MSNSLDINYINLLTDILDNGVKKQTRNGSVISVFDRNIIYDFKNNGFPILTTKKMFFKGIVTELIWFLTGNTSIKYLLDNNCHIWDGDCYEAYLKKVKDNPLNRNEFIEKIQADPDFALLYGDLGPIYGNAWRNWGGNSNEGKNKTGIDQLAWLINELKENPDSRRLILNSWVVKDLNKMVLPPCHYGFQLYSRELTWAEKVDWVVKNTDVELENVYITEEVFKKTTPVRALSLKWFQRSVDVPLGLPFNITSYGLLLEIICKMVNMVPDVLIGNLGDTHIYENQIEGCYEQIKRNGYPLPKLIHNKSNSFYKKLSDDLSLFNELSYEDFKLDNYISHPTINFKLSN